jgi:hypothetical protein
MHVLSYNFVRRCSYNCAVVWTTAHATPPSMSTRTTTLSRYTRHQPSLNISSRGSERPRSSTFVVLYLAWLWVLISCLQSCSQELTTYTTVVACMYRCVIVCMYVSVLVSIPFIFFCVVLCVVSTTSPLCGTHKSRLPGCCDPCENPYYLSI